MKRCSVLVMAVVFFGSASVSAQEPRAVGSPLTLQELEQLALENNPTIRAAESAIEAARSRARQAGAWPNPIVGYTGEELTTRRIDPRGEHGFFVEQTVPLGGKLRSNRVVFERAAEEAGARAEQQRRRIVSSVRTLFYRLLTAERRIEVQERLTTLGADTSRVTAQLFNVGAADRPDFLESEIEARRVQLALNAARNEVFALRQQLAASAGRPDVAARPIAGTIDSAIPELERDATMRALIDRSPQVRAARAAAARAQAATALARQQTSPDLFVRAGAAYNREHGDVTGTPIGWQGQLAAGLTIPLFNRNPGGIAAARAEEAAAQAELARVELSLRAQAAVEFASYLTALRAAESFRSEILPRGEQAYTLYVARYREMAAAYPQVLLAQRMLFDLSREYLQHLETAWRSALRLQEFLVGEGLDAPVASGETVQAAP
jgi:cobalt-zinc-cadmium efflux system outer membrane protein